MWLWMRNEIKIFLKFKVLLKDIFNTGATSHMRKHHIYFVIFELCFILFLSITRLCITIGLWIFFAQGIVRSWHKSCDKPYFSKIKSIIFDGLVVLKRCGVFFYNGVSPIFRKTYFLNFEDFPFEFYHRLKLLWNLLW